MHQKKEYRFGDWKLLADPDLAFLSFARKSSTTKSLDL